MSQELSWFREPALDELRTIPFKPVDREIVRHTIERRGFVTVPLDYSRPHGPKVDIFYRLIPAAGAVVAEASSPTVVVINGGPGMPSSLYRPYDFDYSGKRPAKADCLGELSKHFRVLILDQRGTAGNSCPLDLDNPGSRCEIIARYFDSRHVALDHQEIINNVLPGEAFFMIAQSYGGMVGMHYMSLPEISRLPKGICFSSAGMPHGDFLDKDLRRRAKQKEMNLQLLKNRPDIIPKILELREHFRNQGVDPDAVHHLWTYLGKGEEGEWERNLGVKIDALLALGRKGLEEFVAEADGCNFLNYILSGPMNTPGYTDSTMAQAAIRALPYAEPWMLDECRILQMIGRDGTWRQAAIEAMDASPHPGLPYPSPEEIKRGLSRSRVLFSFAHGDIFLPLEVVRENARRFSVPGVTSEIVLSGGHKAIFLPKGVKAFCDWALAGHGHP